LEAAAQGGNKSKTDSVLHAGVKNALAERCGSRGHTGGGFEEKCRGILYYIVE
jgi:hypothetical protein